MRMTTGRGPVVSQLQVAAAAKAALCTYTNALRCQCVALLDTLQVRRCARVASAPHAAVCAS